MKLLPTLAVLSWRIFVSSKVIIDVNDEVFPCDFSPYPIMGLSLAELEYDIDQNDDFIINGPVFITEDFEAPIGLNISSLHLERGEWRTGFFGYVVKDFCPDMLNPLKPWYFFTKNLNRTSCPFPKGHVEIFDNFKFGSYGSIIPFTMLGEWKFFWEVSTKRNGEMIKECNMQRISMTEA